MPDFLNRRVSTFLGIVIIVIFIIGVGGFLVKQYADFMSSRFEPLGLELGQ